MKLKKDKELQDLNLLAIVFLATIFAMGFANILYVLTR